MNNYFFYGFLVFTEEVEQQWLCFLRENLKDSEYVFLHTG